MKDEKTIKADGGAILLKAPEMAKPLGTPKKQIHIVSNKDRVDTSNFLEFDYFDKKK